MGMIGNFFENLKVNKNIKIINKALNINLTRWQADYIFYNVDIPNELNHIRGCGKTTARILRILFSKGKPIVLNYPANLDKLRRFLISEKIVDDGLNTNRGLCIFINELLNTRTKLLLVNPHLKLRYVGR